MTQKRECSNESFCFFVTDYNVLFFLPYFVDRGLRPFQVSNNSTALTRTIRINGLVCQRASLVI